MFGPHFVLGGAFAGINFLCFAAAETVPDRWKSNAISYVMASGLVAAFIGPAVFSITKDLMPSGAYVGAYAAIAGLGCIEFLSILAFCDLSPVSADASAASLGQALAVLSRPKIAIAASGAAVSQAVMVLLMTPTALAIVGCGFAEGQAADVVKWHVIAMFAPGFITGALIQCFGVMPIITIGLAALFPDLTAIYGVAGYHMFSDINQVYFFRFA